MYRPSEWIDVNWLYCFCFDRIRHWLLHWSWKEVFGYSAGSDAKRGWKPQFHSAECGLLWVHLLGTDFRIRKKRSTDTGTHITLHSHCLYHQINLLNIVRQISEHHYDVPHLVSPTPPPLPSGLAFQSSSECEPPISLMSLASSPRPSSHTSTIDKAPHSDSERSLSSTLSSSCKTYLLFIGMIVLSILLL